MEKKLKKALDSFDEKEADKLLEGVEVKGLNDHGLNVDAIMNRVYEQTGTKEKQTGKVVVIPWKKVAKIAVVAACFLLVFAGGYLAGGINGDKPESPGTDNPNVADADGDKNTHGTIDNPVTDNDGDADVTVPGGEVYDDSKDNESDESGKDNNEDLKDKDDNKLSDDKGNGKTHNDKNNNNTKDKIHDNIMMGIDEESRFLGMQTDDIEELMSVSDGVIDMEALEASYVSVNDLVNDSDYVVKAVKTSSVFKRSGKKHIYKLASKVTVKSVLVNNVEEDMEELVRVNEGILYSAKDSCYTQIGGYTRMKLGYEYILFLKRSASGKAFDITGFAYGKVPMDKSEQVLSTGSNDSDADKVNDIKFIIESARKKYSDYNPDSEPSSNPDKTDKSDKSDKSDSSDKSDEQNVLNNSNNSNNANSSNNSGNQSDSDKKDTSDKQEPDETPEGGASGSISVTQ